MPKFKTRSQPRDGKSAISGVGCLGIFGLIFALAGTFFTLLVAKDFLGTLEAGGWDKVPATLHSAEISVTRGKDDPFVLRTTFSYRVEGRELTSNSYGLKERKSDSYEKLALVIRDLRARRELTAYVNPKNPGEAVLHRGSLLSGFLILFPLIFVAIGVACIIGALRLSRKSKLATENKVEAISSSPTRKSAGAQAGIIIGVILVLIGLGLLYPLGIRPLAQSSAARNWTETPCKIIWASVKSHQSDDGTTYSVDIFYSYQFEGQEHRSNRYSFLGGSSSGSKGKRKIVDQFRKDKTPTCYVDPKLPERAVLKRELGAGGLLALIPSGFILIGLAMAVSSYRFKKKQQVSLERPDSNPYLQPEKASPPASAPQTFAPGKKRLLSALGLLLLALFWNGMVFGFLFTEAWLEDGGLFLKLFSIPFMLVGVLIALGFLHNALAIFNPRAILTLEPGEIQLGVPATLKWRFKGSTGRLRSFQIVIRGIEKATYRRGTDSVTDTRSFYAAALTEHQQAMTMHGGTVEFTLPHDLMYTLRLANNAIIWRIQVKGEIAFWPDVADKYDLLIHPYPTTSRSS